MTTRELPFEEWWRLEGTDLNDVWHLLDPSHARIAVVEDVDGLIIGCCALFSAFHADGWWTKEEHRGKAGVNIALLSTVQRWAVEAGARGFLMTADSPQIAEYLHRLGGHILSLPGATFIMPIKES